jgi:WD40 repeat protein
MRRIIISFVCAITIWCISADAQTTTQTTPLTLSLAATLTGYKEQVDTIAFSPNGEILAASSSKENKTRLWRTANGQLLAALEGTQALFSPDGRFLLTLKGKEAKLWDATNGRLRYTLSGHEGRITDANFSPDGNKIATGSEDGTVQLWDTANGQPTALLVVWQVKKMARWRIMGRALRLLWVRISFSPDGSKILTYTLGEDSSAKLWDVATGSLQFQLGGHTAANFGVLGGTKSDGVRDASFSPDGRFVVTQAIYTWRLWRVDTGELAGEAKPGMLPGFSPDSKYLVFSDGKELKLQNLATGTSNTLVNVDDLTFAAPEFSSDGKICVVSSGYYDCPFA